MDSMGIKNNTPGHWRGKELSIIDDQPLFKGVDRYLFNAIARDLVENFEES